MKKTYELERSDLDVLHDIILGALDYPADKLTDNVILSYWEKLPEHIKDDAAHWDIDDTVVRDTIYEWLEENLKNV